MDVPEDQECSGRDGRDLEPECHSPAVSVCDGSTYYSSSRRTCTVQDVDATLVETSIGNGDEIGYDDSLGLSMSESASIGYTGNTLSPSTSLHYPYPRYHELRE